METRLAILMIVFAAIFLSLKIVSPYLVIEETDKNIVWLILVSCFMLGFAGVVFS